MFTNVQILDWMHVLTLRIVLLYLVVVVHVPIAWHVFGASTTLQVQPENASPAIHALP